MKVQVRERDLIITETERLVAQSVNEYTVQFTLDAAWDGYAVEAVFQDQSGVLKAKVISDGAAVIPWEVLQETGYIRIGVFGVNSDHTRPTVWSALIPVYEGADDGDPSTPTASTPWQEALAQMGEDVEDAAESASAAEAAQAAAEAAAAMAAASQGSAAFTLSDAGHLIVTWTDTSGESHNTDIGEVSAYAVAVKNGYTGTEAQWEQYIANASTNAQAAAASKLDAEAYAVGKRGGVDVESTDPAYHNNSKYFAEQAETAKTAAQTAAASASAAYGTDLLADDYSSEKTYVVGEPAIYSGGMYWCAVQITTPEAWTAAHWSEKPVAEAVSDLKSASECIIPEYGLSQESTINYNIRVSNSYWQYYTAYHSYYFDLPYKSKYLIMEGNVTNGTPYALLKSDDVPANNTLPQYAEGTSRQFVDAGSRITVEIPDDCAKIWILDSFNSSGMITSYAPPYLAFVPDYVTREMLDLTEQRIDILDNNSRSEDIDFSDADVLGGLISNQTGNWVERENYNSYLVEIPDNAVSVQFVSGANGSVIGILRTGHLANEYIPPYAEGCSRTYIPPNTIGDFDLPEDAAYIVILKSVSSTVYTPNSGVFSKAIYATPKDVNALIEAEANQITHYNIASDGVRNVVRRCRQLTDVKWIPAVDIPRISAILGGGQLTHYEDVFKAGVEYTGVPYGQATKNCAAWGKPKANGGLKVGWGVGIDTFVSAIMTPGSCVALDSEYTASGATHLACFYATVCTALCGYAYNLPQYYSSTDIDGAPGIRKKGRVSSMPLTDIAIGDMLYNVEHGAIVTDKIEKNGVVTAIELSEATVIGCEDWNVQGSQLGGLCRRKFWSASDIMLKWSGYDVYSYDYIDDVPYTKSPYVNTGGEGEYVRPMYFPVLPYMGENFEYVAGKIVNSKILTPAYRQGVLDKLRVTKDGLDWNSDGTTNLYDVSGDYVVVDFVDPGTYTAYLSNADGTIKTISCHWTVVSAS